MLSSNPIAGFFDSQYLWKEDIDNGDFFHEDIHTVEVASKTITFKCLEILSYAQTCMNLQRVPLSKLGTFSD